MSHRTSEGLQAGFPIDKARELGHSIPSQPLNGGQTLPQGIEGEPIIVNGQIIGWNIGGEFFTQAEVDSLIATGNFPEDPATGGGAGRTQFPSEAERDAAAAELARARAGAVETPEERAARLQFDIDRAAADREADIEAAALREEGANRRERLGTLARLIEGFLGQQSQARDTLANLQPDPFRFAAVAGGIAPFGTTPQQGFQTQLQQFAGAQVPQFDPSGSAASLDPIIAQLTGAQAPQAPQIFGGLAGGGTVPAPFETMSARMVGEAGPEVMITSPQGVTILPLGKGAQEGGFFPFEPIDFDASTLFPALGTSGIFGSLGLDTIPKRTKIGRAGETLTSNFGALSTLGVRPTFVRDVSTGDIWKITGNTRQHITTTQALSGLDRSNIVGAHGNEIARLAPTIGQPISSLAQANPPVSTEQPSSFTKFSAPVIEPTTGTLLPAPFMVAEQLNKLRLTKPFAFNLILSAYKSAGVSVEAVLGGVQGSLSFGAERGAIGLR